MRRALAVCLGLAAIAGPAGAGSIAGQITYEDERPPLERIRMDDDPACAAKHGRPVRSQRLLLGESNGISNVFIRIMNVPRGEYEAPAEPVVVDRSGCLYEPHVVGVMVGQRLRFVNSDGVPHTVHGLPKEGSEFNVTLQPGATGSEHVLKTGEAPFEVKCDLHAWELGYVGVLPHPFFTISREDGTFELDGVPDGRYWVEAWHEQLGSQRLEVEVSNDTALLDFTFEFKHPPR